MIRECPGGGCYTSPSRRAGRLRVGKAPGPPTGGSWPVAQAYARCEPQAPRCRRGSAPVIRPKRRRFRPLAPGPRALVNAFCCLTFRVECNLRHLRVGRGFAPGTQESRGRGRRVLGRGSTLARIKPRCSSRPTALPMGAASRWPGYRSSFGGSDPPSGSEVANCGIRPFQVADNEPES